MYDKAKDLKEALYSSDAKLEKEISKIKNHKGILEENKALVLDYVNHCHAKDISAERIRIILRFLDILARSSKKHFKELDKKDMEVILTKFVKSSKYSEWTKETYRSVIKTFFRWLYDLNGKDALPPVVSWIVGTRPPSSITKDDLITKKDLEKILVSTNNAMHKALLSVAYESAARPGELLSMRLKDIKFEENVVHIKVRGKMEKKIGDRYVFLTNSYDILRNWLSAHPFKEDQNYPVWINCNKGKKYGHIISLAAYRQLVTRTAKRADITKRIYPYIFRHSRGTEIYKELGEALAKQFMGHSPDSRMARVYNHLNETDLLEAIKQSQGLVSKPKEEDNKICARCAHINTYDSNICSRCGLPQTTKSVLEQRLKRLEDEKSTKLLLKLAQIIEESPELLKLLENKISQI